MRRKACSSEHHAANTGNPSTSQSARLFGKEVDNQPQTATPVKKLIPKTQRLPPDYQKFNRECGLTKKQEKEVRQLYARAAFYDLDIQQVMLT